MLCKKCSAIPFPDPGCVWHVRHHETFAELNGSAENGCPLCGMFKKVTLEYYANFVFGSIDKAERYHRFLDECTNTYQELKIGTAPADPSDRKAESGEEESEGYEDDEYPSCFFVGAVPSHCDNDFAPLEKGLRSLTYTREPFCEDGDLDFGFTEPLQDIWPVVRISCLPGNQSCNLVIIMLTFVGNSVPHNWHVIGRPTPRMPDPDLGKSWLEECLEKHTVCRRSKESHLPTRVLDLASGTDIQLRIDLEISQPYATLSHRWGESESMKLTKDTLKAFQERIVYSELPQTFRDAVAVSRALGIRYLWIDSLCIIQDSETDWEEQCAVMARIYSESIITIAAPAAPCSSFGFLHPREMRCQTTIQTSDDNFSSEVFISPGCIRTGPFDLIPGPDSMLAQRGWVLQERLLSARVLYFGCESMYFECSTNVRIDSCHYPLEELSMEGIEKSALQKLEYGPGSIQDWMLTAKVYSRTELTRPIDKLPALSGLASYFHRYTKVPYLAGLWHQDLHRQLCWHTRVKIEDGIHGKPSSEVYMAPSWSWASVNRPVTFLVTNCHSTTFDADMDILDSQITMSSKDMFGLVESGYLKVRGRVRSAIVRKDLRRKTLFVQGDAESTVNLAIYCPDNGYANNTSEFEVILLYLGTFSNDGTAAALVIRRDTSDERICKRIGLAYADGNSRHEGFKNFAMLFREAEKIDLHIL
jgi:hypothetical protein